MYFKRAAALCAVLGFSFFAAGCSGNSAATPPVIPTDSTAPIQDAAPSDSAPRTSMTTGTVGSTVKLVGKIIYDKFYSSSGGFEVSAGAAGNVWIYANSGTSWSYNGLSFKLGDYVTVSGTWKNSTTVLATSASLSTSGSPGILSGTTAQTTSTQSAAVTGQIVYASFYSSSGGFEVKEGNGTNVWVYRTSTTQMTYNGLSVKVGTYVSANGTWKNSTTLYASSISLSSTMPSSGSTAAPTTITATPAPSAGVPKHVQTAEYLWSSTETSTSPSVYAPYLNWAYTLNSRAGMTRSAGIKTVLYTSPMMPNSNTYEYNELNGTYAAVKARTCSGTIVKTYSGTGLLADPTRSGTSSYFQNIVNHVTSAVSAANPGYSHPWDLIFIDNDGPLYGASATPCNYSATTWGTAQDSQLATTGQKFILNSLSVADSNVPTYVSRLKGSAIAGGEFEECFMTSLWASEEDAQLQTIALLKSEGKPGGAGFWCYADNTKAAAYTATAQRMYIYASFLLTYDPNYSVFQESFSTPSTFKVMPETGFVPMSPVSVPSAVTGLATSTGAYLQRYNSCYYRGSLIGRCEIIVNPSTTSYVSVPNPWALHHSMVLSGNGVLDGGSVSFSGAVPSRMGPKSGLILTP